MTGVQTCALPIFPEYIRDALTEAGVEWKEAERMEGVMPELDILYMTRVQRERFFNEEDYIRLKDSYIFDMEKLKSWLKIGLNGNQLDISESDINTGSL